MTRRERLERKLARREEWADKRRQKAEAVEREATRYRGDHAFCTQPGHIPERARLNRREARARQDLTMAEHHERRAAGLARQLDRSIYSDDHDAIQALETRIAEREAEAERRKRINRAWRKTAGTTAERLTALFRACELTSEERGTIALSVEHGSSKPFPSWSFNNLRASIRRDRQRIEEIRRRAERAAEADNAPGGVLITRTDGGYCNITFAEKPPREVRDRLKAAGFHWMRGSWGGYQAKIPSCILEMEQAG